jgi:hypothetical protein
MYVYIYEGAFGHFGNCSQTLAHIRTAQAHDQLLSELENLKEENRSQRGNWRFGHFASCLMTKVGNTRFLSAVFPTADHRLAGSASSMPYEHSQRSLTRNQ